MKHENNTQYLHYIINEAKIEPDIGNII